MMARIFSSQGFSFLHRPCASPRGYGLYGACGLVVRSAWRARGGIVALWVRRKGVEDPAAGRYPQKWKRLEPGSLMRAAREPKLGLGVKYLGQDWRSTGNRFKVQRGRKDENGEFIMPDHIDYSYKTWSSSSSSSSSSWPFSRFVFLDRSCSHITNRIALAGIWWWKNWWIAYHDKMETKTVCTDQKTCMCLAGSFVLYA